jgi:predicted NBD/HSP70 family sugar kinase
MNPHSVRLGIDVGGTSVKMALLADGQTVWTRQSRFYSRPDTPQLIAALREAAGGRLEPVNACGICVPGILDDDRAQVTLSVNVPGLMTIPIRRLVQDALGEIESIRVCNDAISCATDVVEAMRLRGRTLLLAMGTGVGAAVLDGTVPLLVDGESPGHLGMIDVTCDHPPSIGPDGGAGSLEAYCGVPALRARYGDDLEASIARWTHRDPPLIALARAIRIGHALYRPHQVVLAGGLGIRFRPKLPLIEQLVETHLTSVARADRRLMCAQDDFHAARGAAKLVSS